MLIHIHPVCSVLLKEHCILKKHRCSSVNRTQLNKTQKNEDKGSSFFSRFLVFYMYYPLLVFFFSVPFCLPLIKEKRVFNIDFKIFTIPQISKVFICR